MTALRIGIAGAGLLGRLLAWRLARGGHRVEVFDPAAGPQPAFDGQQAAAFTAAGMLSPLAEMDKASSQVATLGWRSIALWRAVLARIRAPDTLLRQHGSLLLAHGQDLPAARNMLARLAGAPAPLRQPQALSHAECARLEPSLQGVAHAWLLPDEGQIDPAATLELLYADAARVAWHWGCTVTAAEPFTLRCGHDASAHAFDLVFDVRGTGARPELPVRGVRGETVWLRLPAHGLGRPVRLLHPRHRVYIVPRGHDLLLLGATEIESDDRSPVSLRSAVELMSAAHSVLPALAEARILRLDVNLRPALPDNEARIDDTTPGIVRINGLFRHGWLIAPALVEDALRALGLLDPGENLA